MRQVRQKIRDKCKREAAIWRVRALPGFIVVALIIGLRFMGQLQFFERLALDYLLRLRPSEPVDERILIVGINEADIRQIGTYPIPDRHIAALFTTLQSYDPAVIGLDIYRDLPIEPGHSELVQAFSQMENLIAIEKALSDRNDFTVNPPQALAPEQVGFADAVLDSDGRLRRSLLGTSVNADTSNDADNYKFSFTIRLAETYLASQGITLENGIRDPDAMRFGSTELNRVSPNSGGYVGADDGGNQVLLNFRSGFAPFRIVSLEDVTEGRVPEAWIRDRIVLIGITALSAKDVINSAAIDGVNPGLVYGVEIQAHAISQITSAVLDGRPLLKTWSDGWEYVWILVWGLLGISLGRIFTSPLKILLGLAVSCVTLTGVCYSLLLIGWWVPIVPTLLVLVLNGTGLTALLFYRYQQDLKSKIQDRQLIIDRTFDSIHNGPLQTLAGILRTVQERPLSPEQLYLDLKCLNQELRDVYESVLGEISTQRDSIILSPELKLDLTRPTHEILDEIYTYTLARDLPCFKTLKLKVTTFKQIDTRSLTLEQKRGLCRFLEEALCNVGKHAVGVTRIDVICKQEQNQNVIRVIDNGVGIDSSSGTAKTEGRGTQQARELARQLNGTFQRLSLIDTSSGTMCELRWAAVAVRMKDEG
ncbi:MAG: CHASE2 domain-containing protein [Leptolyngbyaceae cyanobacterium RM2_2_4]|nr:CHASE2 domain-containing protein [Leptolyngbyaceae cyanobacterium RM2_2_4]